MGKWTVFLLTCIAAGCASREVRCDGHLTAINPPVAHEVTQTRGSGDPR